MWTYEEALDYLYGFVNYEVRREVRYAPSVMNLDRPLQLLEKLGNPHQQYPTIHITGTKGKGSVGAYCLAALQAAGLRTGLYSSPHLQDFRERFRINDEMIAKPLLTTLLAEIKPAADQIPELTWFEMTTALAFLYFAHEQTDVVVCEVGLGGRLDATNVITPLVSVITSLSYDHTHLLGDTLAKIAVEKAGIIKQHVPVVSAPQPQEALAVLESVAAERNAPVTLVGRDWDYVPGSSSLDGQRFQAGPVGDLAEYWTPLAGGHQSINGTVALAALSLVRQSGVNLPPELVAGRRLQANWPGRFEVVNERPWVVLDAAHNGASAMCLKETLAEVFPDQGRVTLVFGASADKDVSGMFEAILPITDHLVLAKAVHPRATSPDELAALAEGLGYRGTIEKIPVVTEALDRAKVLAGSEGIAVVTGSLFIVGEARDVIGLLPGQAAHRGIGRLHPLSGTLRS